jgi:Transposase IS116/IS110/IS902 family
MLRPLRGLRWLETWSLFRSPAPAMSKRYGRCESRGTRRSRPAPRSQTRFTRWSTPPPTGFGPNSVAGQSWAWSPTLPAGGRRHQPIQPPRTGGKPSPWNSTTSIDKSERSSNRQHPNSSPFAGVGIETAATLLIAAGDNPERLSRECSFAALCGVSPVDRSSGRQRHHSLNRGGNRDANRAGWRIALVRMSHDPITRAYVERRTKDGKSKRAIIRCLKRYIARSTYPILIATMTEGCNAFVRQRDDVD